MNLRKLRRHLAGEIKRRPRVRRSKGKALGPPPPKDLRAELNAFLRKYPNRDERPHRVRVAERKQKALEQAAKVGAVSN